MSSASITITDEPGGTITVSAEFGTDIDRNSQAHNLITVLLESVLNSAKFHNTIADTAPALDVEPSKIITSGV